MSIKELRKYRKNENYSSSEVAKEILQLSNIEDNKRNKIQNDLECAIHTIKALAENEYNSDYWRTFYNVLLVIVGFECFNITLSDFKETEEYGLANVIEVYLDGEEIDIEDTNLYDDHPVVHWNLDCGFLSIYLKG